MHNMIFDMNPDEPIFEEELLDGGDWDFREWLRKVNGNDDEKVKWLLYVMGLCMLPNTNIGANVMLQGDSGSGKSTIGTLISNVYTGPSGGYGQLYDSTVDGLINNQHTANTLNEDFPFRGSLTPKINFVHLSEMNGIRLSTDAGILFDKFADNDLDAKQLHAKSFKLTPSPTLFIEGTKWASFSTVKHGVERRALPVALNPTSDLQDYAAIDMEKREIFEDEVVLSWLVRECFKTIREVRGKKLSRIHLNLLREPLPDFVQAWRNEIISGGDEIAVFYDKIKETLEVNKPIRFAMLFEMYRTMSEKRGVKYTKNLHNFTESIIAKFESEGFDIDEKGNRYKEDDLAQIGINTRELAKVMEVPKGLQMSNYEQDGFGAFLEDDWFVLKVKK